jgi:hypothetical protein
MKMILLMICYLGFVFEEILYGKVGGYFDIEESNSYV